MHNTSLRAALLALLALPALVAAGVLAAPSAHTADVPRCDGFRATLVADPDDPDGRAVGTPGRDVILGSGAPERIEGRGGNDVLCGGPGADVIVGGRGYDRLRDGAGSRVVDVLRGGPTADTLWSTAGRDVLVGGRGGDAINALAPTPPVVRDGPGDDAVWLLGLRTLGGLDVGFDGRGDQDSLRLQTENLVGGGVLRWDMRRARVVGPDGRSGRLGRAFTSELLESSVDVVVHGTGLAEELVRQGSTGRTRFVAAGGPDALLGGSRRDTFLGGRGTDTYDADSGRPGTNRCVSVERDPHASCER